uniref:Phosphatidylinositol transfer protein n=1 Tax=Schistosoma mansoni TaxID=6183 RepID=A0A5K4FAB3_SCHMA
MIVKEYRVILPMTVEEYQVGQLYSVAETSKGETGGGDGVQILVNEPFDQTTYKPDRPLLKGDPRFTTGQYTHKYYHLAQKVPGFLRVIAPESAFVFNEYAWNAYPYCRTIITNNYMMEKFSVTIESLHMDSLINVENAHQLSPEKWAEVEVIYIDIGDISQAGKDYNPNEDPTTFRSEKTGRGPLKPKWWENGYKGPIMCAYKLVSCEFKVWGMQGRIEKMIQRQERRLFANFHRQVFCWMDKWHGWTMEDVRLHEEQTKKELEEQRTRGSLRGHVTEE